MKKVLWICLIGAMIAASAPGQTIITSVVRTGGATDNRAPIGAYTGTTAPLATQAGGIKDGNYVFSDRTFTFTTTPTGTLGVKNRSLIGSEYIRTFNSDRNNTTMNYAVTISFPATVWITVDDRFTTTTSPTAQGVANNITNKFAAAGTFKDTGLHLFYNGDSNRQQSIYAAELAPGTYNFSHQGSTANNNYIIGAVLGDMSFNPPPVVAAAPKYSRIYPGGTVQLSGTITDQPPVEGDPGTLSWYWAKESGPGTVTFAPDSNAKDPIATFSTKGMYTLFLQASDGTKDANDVVNVYVSDRADEKLIGYWDMENTLEDKSVNNNNGTLYFNKRVSAENRFVADAAIGSASIDLNTTEATPISYYVYLGQAPELDFSTGGPGDFTVTAWVKTLAERNVFSKGGDDVNGIRYVLAVGENGAGRVDQVTDDNVTKVEALSSGVVNDGKWHFIAGQRSGNVTRVYVDGVLAGTATLPGVSYNLSGTSQKGAYIGVGINQQLSGVPITEPNSVNAKRFLGKIDDVRVYNYPLALTDAAGFDSIRALAVMANLPASVNAGPDGSFIIKPGLSYPLAGVVTDYGKPDIATILWTTVSGPDGAEAVFANPSSPTSTVTFPKGGVFTLKLTVIDATGTGEDTVVITTTTPTCADVIAAGLIQKTDLNKDCYVNIQDLAIMLQNWTKCNDPESLNVNCIWPF
jgi:hypothetical protein